MIIDFISIYSCGQQRPLYYPGLLLENYLGMIPENYQGLLLDHSWSNPGALSTILDTMY